MIVWSFKILIAIVLAPIYSFWFEDTVPLLIGESLFISWCACASGWVARNQTNRADIKDATSMCKRVCGRNPSYLRTLTFEDLKRFREKLKIRVGDKIEVIQSLYEVWDDENLWSDTPVSWPQICWGDIYSYLIESPGPFTHVRPGQAESRRDSHLPWVIAKENGKAITAHCDCKAGQAFINQFLISFA